MGQLVSLTDSFFISFFRLTIGRDVDELKAMKEEILSTDLLDVKLGGVSFTGWSWGN